MKTQKVYLDHNIWNAVAPEKSGEWFDSKWSKLLLPKIEKGEIELFVSPANIFELILFANIERRHAIAKAMNTMIKGLNILPASEYVIIEEILTKINSNWPNSVNFQYFNKLRDNVTIVYIGLLGQLASLANFEVGKSGYSTLLKNKYINLIIHLKILENPRHEIKRRLDQFEGIQIEDPYLENLNNLTIEQLHSEVDAISARIKKADGNTVQYVNKNKSKLVAGFSKSLIMESAGNIFNWTQERALTISDHKNIIENWNLIDECNKQSNNIIAQMPEHLLDASKNNKIAFQEYDEFFYEVIARFNKCSPIATHSTEIILNELINSMKSGEEPTKGLSMDSDHFVAAINCDILVTQDGQFYSTCKKLFNDMAQVGIKKYVVKSDGELLRSLSE